MIESIGHENFLNRTRMLCLDELGCYSQNPSFRNFEIFSFFPLGKPGTKYRIFLLCGFFKCDLKLLIEYDPSKTSTFEMSPFDDGNDEETQTYFDVPFFPNNADALFNNIALSEAKLLYPSKNIFRCQTQNALKIVKPENWQQLYSTELEKFNSLANAYESTGLNYSKMKNPVVVFNHRCPRSLMSLWHILVETAPESKK